VRTNHCQPTQRECKSRLFESPVLCSAETDFPRAKYFEAEKLGTGQRAVDLAREYRVYLRQSRSTQTSPVLVTPLPRRCEAGLARLEAFRPRRTQAHAGSWDSPAAKGRTVALEVASSNVSTSRRHLFRLRKGLVWRSNASASTSNFVIRT
jgi:hypothetical protein